jgi:hypothetical protein
MGAQRLNGNSCSDNRGSGYAHSIKRLLGITFTLLQVLFLTYLKLNKCYFPDWFGSHERLKISTVAALHIRPG